MPIDGTYGRFSAHNQRFKELRRKKLERREHKILQNSLNSINEKESGIETNFKSVEPEKLEAIKIEIRRKAKAQLWKESFFYIISLILACGLIYFLYFYKPN